MIVMNETSTWGAFTMEMEQRTVGHIAGEARCEKLRSDWDV